jgi:hypothetical protein
MSHLVIIWNCRARQKARSNGASLLIAMQILTCCYRRSVSESGARKARTSDNVIVLRSMPSIEEFNRSSEILRSDWVWQEALHPPSDRNNPPKNVGSRFAPIDKMKMGEMGYKSSCAWE